MQDRRFMLRAAGAAALSGMAVATLAGCGRSKVEFNAVDITGADYAKGFRLTDFNGQQRTLADFKGDVVAIFFGYTQCPDVCPATMSEMARVKELLGEDGAHLQVLFISLDPERDSPQVLKEYMGAFDPGFLALYADSTQELDALTQKYRVFYERVEGDAPGQYSIDHTAASYIYDPQGRVRLFVRYGTEPQLVAADIRHLLNGA